MVLNRDLKIKSVDNIDELFEARIYSYIITNHTTPFKTIRQLEKHNYYINMDFVTFGTSLPKFSLGNLINRKIFHILTKRLIQYIYMISNQYTHCKHIFLMSRGLIMEHKVVIPSGYKYFHEGYLIYFMYIFDSIQK